ncbi:MAG: hypothetical protein JRN30_07210, partial [Nitrososphaerota archaeon]|nr:hypothetical protein [Nitrososphaerota archaeon]
PRQAPQPRDQVVVARPQAPEVQPRAEGGTGVAVPESTVDNPWLDVLARRKARNGAESAGHT